MRKKGNTTNKKIQKQVIQAVYDKMGNGIFDIVDGKRTCLQQTLLEVQKELFPTISIQTMRRWITHFILYGESPAETRIWRENIRGKYRNYDNSDSLWTTQDTVLLKDLIDDRPNLYLDEVQDNMIMASGKKFSKSFLWKKLKYELGYSLQIAMKKAAQRDEEERE